MQVTAHRLSHVIRTAGYGQSAIAIVNNPGDYGEDEHIVLKDSDGNELKLCIKTQ